MFISIFNISTNLKNIDIDIYKEIINKLAKLRRHASQVNFAKIQIYTL